MAGALCRDGLVPGRPCAGTALCRGGLVPCCATSGEPLGPSPSRHTLAHFIHTTHARAHTHTLPMHLLKGQIGVRTRSHVLLISPRELRSPIK